MNLKWLTNRVLAVLYLVQLLHNGPEETSHGSESFVSMSRVRRLGQHNCGLMDYYCCDVNLLCVVCASSQSTSPFTNCGPGTYTQGIFGDNCWSTNNGAGNYKCTLNPVGMSPIDCSMAAKSLGTQSSFSYLRLSGTKTMFSSWTEFYTPGDASCTGYASTCVLSHVSNTDQTSIITSTTAGAATVNTNSVVASHIGTGTYRWKCGGGLQTVYSNSFTLTIGDVCQSPNVLTPQTYAAISKTQFDDSFASVYNAPAATTSTFVTISDSSSGCTLTGCKLVTSTSTTCSTTTATSAFTLTQTGTNIAISLDTSSVITQAYYCVECTTNDLSPSKKYSNPFQMQVLPFDCSTVISGIATSLANVFEPIITPGASAKWVNKYTGTNYYGTNTQPTKCPITFSLINTATGSVYSGSTIQFDTSTGQIKIDVETKATTNVKVRLTSINGYQQDTNAFELKVACPTMTQTALTALYAYTVPTVAAGSNTQVVQASDYVTATGGGQCIPNTFTLRDSSGNTLGSVPTGLTFTTAGTLTVDTNTVQSNDLKIGFIHDNTNYLTSLFTVRVSCPTMTQTALNALYAYTVPTVAAGSNTQVVQASDYVTATGIGLCVPSSFTLRDTSGVTLASVPTGLTFSASGTLTVDTNTVQSNNFKIGFSHGGTNYLTSAFTVRVTCPTMTQTNLNALFAYLVPNTVAATQTQVAQASDYVTATGVGLCVPSSFTLRDSSGVTLASVPTGLTFTAAGTLTVDTNTPQNNVLKIGFSHGGTNYLTNAFTVKVECPTMTQTALNAMYAYLVPNAVAASQTQVVQASDYVTASGIGQCIPSSFTLKDSSGTNYATVPTGLTFTAAGTLTVDTNTLQNNVMKIGFTHGGVNYVTSTFTVKVECPTMTQNALNAVYGYYIPQFTAASPTQVVAASNYVTATGIGQCIPRLFTLKDSSGVTIASVPTGLTFTAAGTLSVDTNVLSNNNLKIGFTHGTTTYMTNTFNVKVECPPMTQTSLAPLFKYTVPVAIAGSLTEVVKVENYVATTGGGQCLPNTFTFKDSNGNTMVTPPLGLSLSATGTLSVDVNYRQNHTIKIGFVQDGSPYVTNVFTVQVTCIPLIMPTVADWVKIIPDPAVGSTQDVKFSSEFYSNTPSNPAGCPLTFKLLRANTSAEFDSKWVTQDLATGKVMVNVDVPNEERVITQISYDATTFNTNQYYLRVKCPDFTLSGGSASIIDSYPRYQTVPPEQNAVFRPKSEFSGRFDTKSCLYCREKATYELRNQKDNSLHVFPISLTPAFDLRIDTSQPFINNPIKLQVTSNDGYCNAYFSVQFLNVDIEICGSEKVLVQDPNQSYEFNHTFYWEPNYKMNNFTTLFSLDRVTRCKIYKYELWNSTIEAKKAVNETVWTKFLFIDQNTGLITINHNNKPSNLNYNSTYKVYLTASTLGRQFGQKLLIFNFHYRWVNKSPMFMTGLKSSRFELETREKEQIIGYQDPIAKLEIPIIEDPEADQVFIKAYFDEEGFPCQCVKFETEKSSTGSSAKTWIEIDKTKITNADNLEKTAYIEITDSNYQSTHQKTIYTIYVKIIYYLDPGFQVTPELIYDNITEADILPGPTTAFLNRTKGDNFIDPIIRNWRTEGIIDVDQTRDVLRLWTSSLRNRKFPLSPKDGKPVEMWIKKVTARGFVHLGFNQELLPHPFDEFLGNISFGNYSTAKVQYKTMGQDPDDWAKNQIGLMKNANPRQLQARHLIRLDQVNVTRDVLSFKYELRSDIERKRINFDLMITEWSPWHMILWMNFTDPPAVSYDQLFDKIYIQPHNYWLFVSASTGVHIDKNYKILEELVPRQQWPGYNEDLIVTQAQAMAYMFLTSVIMMIIGWFLFGGSIQDMWVMYFAMQIICYLEIYDVEFPPNAAEFIRKFLTILEWDIFDPLRYAEVFHPFWRLPTALRGQHAYYQIRSDDELISVLDRLHVYIFVVLVWILRVIYLQCKMRQPCSNEISLIGFIQYKKLARLLQYNWIIRLISVMFFEWCIAYKEQIYLWRKDSDLINDFDRFIVIVMIVLSISWLFTSWMLLSKAKEYLDLKNIQRQIYYIYEHIHFMKDYENRWYYPMWVLRRICFVFIPIIITHHAIQVQVLLALILLNAIWYCERYCHEFTRRIRLEIFNQTMTLVLVLHLFTFNDGWIHDRMVIFDYGKSFIVFASIMIAVNLLYVAWRLLVHFLTVQRMLKQQRMWRTYIRNRENRMLYNEKVMELYDVKLEELFQKQKEYLYKFHLEPIDNAPEYYSKKLYIKQEMKIEDDEGEHEIDVNEAIFNDLGNFGQIVDLSRKQILEGFVEDYAFDADYEKLERETNAMLKHVEALPPPMEPFPITFYRSSQNRWDYWRRKHYSPKSDWERFKGQVAYYTKKAIYKLCGPCIRKYQETSCSKVTKKCLQTLWRIITFIPLLVVENCCIILYVNHKSRKPKTKGAIPELDEVDNEFPATRDVILRSDSIKARIAREIQEDKVKSVMSRNQIMMNTIQSSAREHRDIMSMSQHPINRSDERSVISVHLDYLDQPQDSSDSNRVTRRPSMALQNSIIEIQKELDTINRQTMTTTGFGKNMMKNLYQQDAQNDSSSSLSKEVEIILDEAHLSNSGSELNEYRSQRENMEHVIRHISKENRKSLFKQPKNKVRMR